MTNEVTVNTKRYRDVFRREGLLEKGTKKEPKDRKNGMAIM
jgi:hypothetical protein